MTVILKLRKPVRQGVLEPPTAALQKQLQSYEDSVEVFRYKLCDALLEACVEAFGVTHVFNDFLELSDHPDLDRELLLRLNNKRDSSLDLDIMKGARRRISRALFEQFGFSTLLIALPGPLQLSDEHSDLLCEIGVAIGDFKTWQPGNYRRRGED